MGKIKLLFGLGLIVLFVGTSFMAIFGAGQTLQAILKSYVLKVEDCRYDYEPKPAMMENSGSTLAIAYTEQEENCSINYNEAKRDIADGLAMFLVSGPVSIFMFFQGKKVWKTTSGRRRKNCVKLKIHED